jgi:hypothetical protein
VPFVDRFEGSAVHGAARERLSFDRDLVHVNPIKDAWAFVEDDALRYNIAYTLQSVHFNVLLVNRYNVYWTPEAMIFKDAIVAAASVVEAVLQYDLKLVEDDPRVKDTLGKDWVFVDYKEIPLPGVDLPSGQRAVTGLQRMVEKEQLDRNSKMQVLIRAARKVGIVTDELGAALDELRKLRNRIHIKSLEEPECVAYTAKMANDALDLLERYRVVAQAWTVQQKADEFRNALSSRLVGGSAMVSDGSPGVPGYRADDDDDIPF